MSTAPNIVFVFADQLRYDALACNGNRIVRTPNLDRLAREGVAFDQAFSACPVCTPYRGQLLTGRYSHANGALCNDYRLRDDQVTLPQALAPAGYRSAYVGKWHLGHGPYTPAKRYGFDDLIAYNCTHTYFRANYHHNESGPHEIREYLPRAETAMAIDWIENHRQQHAGRPFCLVLSWGPPHWTGGYDGPRDYGDYPREYDTYDVGVEDVPGNVPGPLREYERREWADYLAMVTSLDDCMAELMAELDRSGLAENTILCFSSDHGDHLGAHGYGKCGCHWLPPYMRGNKATPFEEAAHIPFILRYPQRVAARRRSQVMFNSVDVMPSLLTMCGVPVPAGVQGRDLSHAALGGSGPEPDSVYLQNLGTGWPGRVGWTGLWRGVRTKRYTYARWKDRDGFRWLVDRKTDPLEMKNLAGDPAHADLLAQMEALLQQWLTDTGDPFDTGTPLPDTGMLDLGQQLTSARGYDWLSPAYRAAIEKYRPEAF